MCAPNPAVASLPRFPSLPQWGRVAVRAATQRLTAAKVCLRAQVLRSVDVEFGNLCVRRHGKYKTRRMRKLVRGTRNKGSEREYDAVHKCLACEAVRAERRAGGRRALAPPGSSPEAERADWWTAKEGCVVGRSSILSGGDSNDSVIGRPSFCAHCGNTPVSSRTISHTERRGSSTQV